MRDRNIQAVRHCDGGERVSNGETPTSCAWCVGGICRQALAAEFYEPEPEPQPARRRRFPLPTTLPGAMALLGAVFIAAHWLRDLILSLT